MAADIEIATTVDDELVADGRPHPPAAVVVAAAVGRRTCGRSSTAPTPSCSSPASTGRIVGILTLAMYRIPTGNGVDRGRHRRRGGGPPGHRRGAQPGGDRRGPAARRQGRAPDEPPDAGGRQPPVPAHRLRGLRDERLQVPALTGRRPRRPGGPASRGRLRPRASAAATSAARAWSGPTNGASASTARRRIAGRSSVAARMASSPRSSPIAPSAATAASRTSGSAARAGERDERGEHVVADAARARRRPTPPPRRRLGRGRRADRAGRRRGGGRRA